MKVIAVDDNKKDLKDISAILADTVPDADFEAFDSPLSALARAREQEIDMAVLDIKMPELDGVELGRYLKKMNPFINIIFLSAHGEYALPAMEMHASGYMIKPATADRVRKELAELRYAEKYNDHKRVFVQTFGNFEFFVDGKPVEFKYKKTKEIVAVLVANKGAQTTNGELIANLWEDEGDPEKKISYLKNLRQDLQNTFTRLGLEGIILKQRGSISIAKDRIECDLYDWLEKKDASKYKYSGDFMKQFSWGEFYMSELDNLYYEE